MPFPAPAKPLHPDVEDMVRDMLVLDPDVIKDLKALNAPPPPIANPVIAAAKLLACPKQKPINDWPAAVAFLPADTEALIQQLVACPAAIAALPKTGAAGAATRKTKTDAAALLAAVTEEAVEQFSTAAHALALWAAAFLAAAK
eukprot:TRINITY_DN4203_c0_g1_i1.p2 TRINITY_DN4203_c0_g1~~TRINITY_DN4203_c0_g1_i1.p2  ORF type:complete len:156 (+),score=31.75 TRINITY_DN4203_c0_g1_i1:38-469(+)